MALHSLKTPHQAFSEPFGSRFTTQPIPCLDTHGPWCRFHSSSATPVGGGSMMCHINTLKSCVGGDILSLVMVFEIIIEL